MHTVDLISITVLKDSPLYRKMAKLPPEGSLGAIKHYCNSIVEPSANENMPPTFLYYSLIKIDCLALLQKQNIETKNDLAIIKQQVNQFLSVANLNLADYRISRIDYCINYYIADPEIRALYFQILNKSSSKIHYVIRKNKYCSGCYHQNGSRVLNIYDKNEERNFNWEPIMPWEKDILRVEHQILNGAVKSSHRPRNFDNWMNLELEKKYLQYCSKIIGSGDYYRIDIAIKRINDSSLSKHYKLALVDYLQKIAVDDMDTVSLSMNRCTETKYKRLLAELGINPVTYPCSKKEEMLHSLIPK